MNIKGLLWTRILIAIFGFWAGALWARKFELGWSSGNSAGYEQGQKDLAVELAGYLEDKFDNPSGKSKSIRLFKKIGVLELYILEDETSAARSLAIKR